jgi:molybdenum cofactor cytidylyltransferase
MSTSIKTGLNFLSKESQGFFVCLGDMPLVNFNIYNKLIKFQKKNNVVIPTYNGEQRNPVLFSISMKEKIMRINGDFGAKEFLKFNNDKLLNVEINDHNFAKDFNTIKNFNL